MSHRSSVGFLKFLAFGYLDGVCLIGQFVEFAVKPLSISSPFCRFILLACDGLFKVFTPEEAVNFILSCLEVRRRTRAPAVWLSGLGVAPQTERLLVHFLVRAQAWVAALVPGRRVYEGSYLVFLSHISVSPSPPLPLALK